LQKRCKYLLGKCENIKTCQFLHQIGSETLGENAVWQVCSMRRAASSQNVVTTRQLRTPLLLKGRFPRQRCISSFQTRKLSPLEEAIRQVTGVVIEFHRKHPAFRTLYAEAPLSKGTVEQKRLLVQTFIDNVSKVLSIRNPKLDRQDALWSAEIVHTALIGFLPALSGRKTSDRSRTIDALNQMLARYLEPVLKPPKR
jgi:hypothetical protein